MIQFLKPLLSWAKFCQKFCHRGVMMATGLLLAMQLWVWATPAYATGVYEMPALTAGEPIWVVDEADILSRVTEAKLSDDFSQLAEKTGNEVRMVTLHRLDYGETADSFADQLFQTWFPTAEAQAQQTLLVLDNVTNNAAIRTGEAIKTMMPDAIATSVAQETLLAPLREGNKYNQALLDAGDRLLAILSGQPDPGPPIVDKVVQTEGTFATAEETNDRSATVVVVVLLLVATIVPMATYYLYQAIQS